VQAFGSSRDILVRLPPDPNAKGDQIGARIIEVFHGIDAGVKLQRTEVVGPQVGKELFEKGGYALVATLVLIAIYVLLRFTFKLALGAILAVLHDPVCVIGFFALSHTTFDLTAISAILAVIGYSLNDTVIVFDRVRERARISRKLSIAQVIDDSINQTLSRTLMTKLVTLLVVVALLIFGGETLHGFSAALVTFRRVARRASFQAPVAFTPAPATAAAAVASSVRGWHEQGEDRRGRGAGQQQPPTLGLGEVAGQGQADAVAGGAGVRRPVLVVPAAGHASFEDVQGPRRQPVALVPDVDRDGSAGVAGVDPDRARTVPKGVVDKDVQHLTDDGR